MKKILFPMLFLFVFSISQAQEGLRFGIKGGVNFSNLYTEDVDDQHVLFGINAGFVALVPITSLFGLQTEVLFSGKGSELEYNNVFVEGKAKFRLNYIEVPILMNINLSENFSFHAGPYVAYLISANIKNDTDNGLFDFEEILDTNDFNRFDYGLSGGFAFNFAPVSLGVRYNYGLANIGKKQTFGEDSYTFPDAKNSALSLYMALIF